MAAIGAAAAAFVGANYIRSGPFSPTSKKIFGFGMPKYPINGTVEPGYESVQTAFANNFATGDEIGASFCAFVGGKCVVDLWGGFKDAELKTPYGEHDINVIFSSGKACASLVVLSLIDKGLLRWDQRVSEIWPEFAAGGKEKVTVEELMSHRGGVSWLEEEFRPTIAETADLDKLEARIAAQPHTHGGVTTKSYHAVTRGWLLNALVRRVDPRGRTIGTIYREEIAPALGLDLVCGMRPEDESKWSKLSPYPFIRLAMRALLPPWVHRHAPLEPLFQSSVGQKDTPTLKSLMGSGPKDLIPDVLYNDKTFLACETPSSSILSNGRALATLGALMCAGGTFRGYTLFSNPSTLESAYSHAEEEPSVDMVTFFDVHYTKAGFAHVTDVRVPDWDMIPFPARWRRPGLEWYGWGGYGGSYFFWCPTLQVSVGYVPNALHATALGDIRSASIIEALMDVAEGKSASKL
ncbi:beta-lactamase/transpeptidase-like protein [Gonapodya prolifera JEL478]|uniref:Beta-lactamase/transpeptidase-like protein n=1 Tax=Gonapodya prolifera (strain JEL478) TaxID=1344416 RepID=A0A139B0K3_GONPJ|nr:beta-lactamase/transpeptidase-like protein [Gonapodya prolifera JEL478]|eukprot:KXS22225.1 beta-lactamase/transpeptidase-like protein [Gonapodya prolifera JEL478]